jgi:hypothetical protein
MTSTEGMWSMFSGKFPNRIVALELGRLEIVRCWPTGAMCTTPRLQGFVLLGFAYLYPAQRVEAAGEGSGGALRHVLNNQQLGPTNPPAV